MKTSLRIFALVATLAVLTAACGSSSPFAALVAGQRISQTALDDELNAIAGNEIYRSQLEQQGNTISGSGKGTFDTAFVARVLTRQILLELVHQEVVKRKLTISASKRGVARDEVEQQVGGPEIFKGFSKAYQATLTTRQAEVVALQEAMADTPVTDKAIAEFYEANKAELYNETCVSHILFADQPKGETPALAEDADASALISQATKAKARVASGEEFAKVAAELSKDQTGDAGGSLGCVGPGNFVPAFEEAMGTLAPGQVSDPVRTQFGIHVIQVTDRKVKTLEDATDDIRQRLVSQSQGDFQTWLLERIEKVTIEVNPKYGKFSNEGGSPQVIPPGRPTTTTAPAGDVPGSDDTTPPTSTP